MERCVSQLLLSGLCRTETGACTLLFQDEFYPMVQICCVSSGLFPDWGCHKQTHPCESYGVNAIFLEEVALLEDILMFLTYKRQCSSAPHGTYIPTNHTATTAVFMALTPHPSLAAHVR